MTNSVLCNPKDEKGNNAPPSKREIASCSTFLRKQIELVNPDIVVTLGGTALQALNLIEEHALSIGENVRTTHQWFGRQLIPLYHPGQRALLHRSFANQLSDYQFVSEQTKRLAKKARQQNSAPRRDAMAIAVEILRDFPQLSYFALHKLFFLVEYTYFLNHAARLTGSYIIRQKDGPYCVDLHWRKLVSSIPGLRIATVRGKMYVSQNAELNIDDKPLLLSEDAKSVIHKVTSTYGSLSDSQLKTAVYLTKAMRSMLRRERTEGINLFNAPIPFEVGIGPPTDRLNRLSNETQEII